jgi:N-methylhydantoinase B
MWDRLVSIVDEILAALVRTSFSTNVRESYDLSCVLFDSEGRSLAQGTYSVPSFTGTAPVTIRHMLNRFHPDTLMPGDVVITNDPWLGTGHLFDINVMRPVFRGTKLVGFTMSITHLPDIGGRGFSATATEVFEEGLRLPICKLVSAGKLNEDLLELIRFNVRVQDQVVGDLMANITCNEVGGRLLLEFMEEYGIDDLKPLSDAILGQSERAMRDKIERMPDGEYENRITVEAVEKPLTLAVKVIIRGREVLMDFSGTDPAVRAGINVPICYTKAFAAYSIKCITIPSIPNNEGSVMPVTVLAPEGCVLNAFPPFPTGGRHIVGHFVTPLVFGALEKAVPQLIQADSGMLNLVNFQGTHRNGRGVSSIFFASGGYGAMDGVDGAPATPSPSNMTGTPIEVWENLTSTTIVRKQLLPDSGGPGKFRGGLGQDTVIRNDSGHLVTISTLAGRTEFAPKGLQGGHPGGLRRYWINDEEVHPKGRYVLKPQDQLRMVEAGGGGFGPPSERSPTMVRNDVRDGFVSIEQAKLIYGVEADNEVGASTGFPDTGPSGDRGEPKSVVRDAPETM